MLTDKSYTSERSTKVVKTTENTMVSAGETCLGSWSMTPHQGVDQLMIVFLSQPSLNFLGILYEYDNVFSDLID